MLLRSGRNTEQEVYYYWHSLFSEDVEEYTHRPYYYYLKKLDLTNFKEEVEFYRKKLEEMNSR